MAHIKGHKGPTSLGGGHKKSVKYHLKRALGRSRLTYEEFETVIIQVEGILNSRPLTPISNDFDNFEIKPLAENNKGNSGSLEKMEYRLSEYFPTERKVDDREGQCNVGYNATDIHEQFNKNIWVDTARKILKRAGYHSRVVRRKPYIYMTNRLKRIDFETDYIHKPLNLFYYGDTGLRVKEDIEDVSSELDNGD
ncbi:hypothetical protein TNCV_4455721 [Trichonephila clavipes]|nr:hypothetical protein TNCV_4455721 [Trichonephila clavipes]